MASNRVVHKLGTFADPLVDRQFQVVIAALNAIFPEPPDSENEYVLATRAGMFYWVLAGSLPVPSEVTFGGESATFGGEPTTW